MKTKYFIESVSEADNKNHDLQTAVISCPGHGCCVKVYGDRKTLTTRLVAVLEGLNEHDNAEGYS